MHETTIGKPECRGGASSKSRVDRRAEQGKNGDWRLTPRKVLGPSTLERRKTPFCNIG